jgi:hypothetical protein
MNDSNTENIWQAERVHKRSDLEQFVVRTACPWKIEEFADIPMGWRSVLTCEQQKVTIWSHRCEIEAQEYVAGEWRHSEQLNLGWNLQQSDFHIIAKILDNARRI